MYPVSETYWNEVWGASRSVSIEATIYGTVEGSEPQTLTIEQIRNINSSDKLMNDQKFELGTAVMRSFNLSFFDDTGSILSVGLGGATLDLYSNLNSTQVFYGRYYIDEVNIKGKIVTCECVDAMAYSDIPYVTEAVYPRTLYQVAQDVARISGLTFSMTSIPNGSLMVESVPTEVTCRQMLQYIAQISGTYAKIERTQGKNLQFIGLTETEKTIPLNATFSIETAENPITITGFAYGENYLAGTNDYAILINDNPILNQFDDTTINSVLSSLLATYGGVSYYPSRATTNTNVAFETGDFVTLTKRDGTTVKTLITQISFTGLSQMKVVGSGATKEKNGYVLNGAVSGRVSEILKEIKSIETEKLPALSEAIIAASDKIVGSVSGYIYIPQEDDPYDLSMGQLLIMDSEVPTEATNLWRWNLNGLGFSSSGVNGTYQTAITQDGAIVADFISTGVLNAEVIRAGMLSSSNEVSWFNLDDGTFNFGDSGLSYDGSTLNIQADNIQIKSGGSVADVASKDDVADVQTEVDDINNALNEQNGFIKIDVTVPSMVLGKDGANANVTITNDTVTITGSDNAQAILTGSKLKSQQAEFGTIYQGNLAWIVRQNEHLSLKRVN